MLHNLNVSGDFPLLTNALREVGVPEEIIRIVPEYLDVAKPRNDKLLEGIEPSWYPGDGATRSHFNQAMRGEIYQTDLRSRDDEVATELRRRWALLCYCITGCHGDEFGMHFGIVEDLVGLFCECWGEEGAARAYAFLFTERMRNTDYRWLHQFPVLSPAICLKAIGLTDSYKAKLAMVIYLLSGCEKPKTGLKGLFSKPDPILQAGLDTLRALYQNGNDRMKCLEIAGAAAAMAAAFSEEWRITLHDHHSQDREPITRFLLETSVDPEPALDQLDAMTRSSVAYINYLACLRAEEWTLEKSHNTFEHFLPTRDKHLKEMAKNDPQAFRDAMDNQDAVAKSKFLHEIYSEVHPDEYLPDLQEQTRDRCIHALCYDNEGYTPEISSYLLGESSLAQFLEVEPKLRHNVDLWREKGVDYVAAFGRDAFVDRCICFQAMVNYGNVFSANRVPGWNFRVHRKTTLDLLLREGIPAYSMVNFCREEAWDGGDANDPLLTRLRPLAPAIAECDPFKDLCLEARRLAMQILSDAKLYDALFAYADDSAKTVRGYLVTYLPLPGEGYDDYYRSLLAAKKQSKREVAAAMLEKRCPDSMKDAVQAALEKEKNAGLQTRLSVILGQAPAETAQALAADDLTANLLKGSKGKKVEFLFDQPFSTVRKTDGEPADEKFLRALAVCYADQTPPGRSAAADALAEGLDAGDLEKFAGEAFARWVALGAPAKTKWVLYLAAVHGGSAMIDSLQRYIKDWAEHSRGAIAAEAANALALNGSSPALMAVDSMARKFKNKQVRSAAGNALQAAADGLGITREELADRIVPDLGFDEKLCRVFDFGTRQFSVYLTPALELEIFEGEKKLKNLPKPGVKDDAEKAEAAVRDFKDMKKQMKTAIQNQSQRLEYALLCDRKWTADGWRELFIRKPVMHCFAIGLIWGVYEDGALVQSFRYMEDGSFNTPDEEEYELPENAVIGLVHPLELDEETRQTWEEQLSDYEIRQPFPQISRHIYRVTDAEQNETKLMRFCDRELVAITLLGRMTKVGWDKGCPMDAGLFSEFLRNDISRQYRNEAGDIVREGFHAELHFSGMYIDGYDNTEDVQIQQVEFRRLAEDALIPLGKLPARYFSEIVYQLTSVLGVAESEEETEE